MKQTLLFLLALCASSFVVAQSQIQLGTPQVEKTATQGNTIDGPAINKVNQNRSVADTLFPAALALECAVPTFFFSDSTQMLGYVIGSNQFADFEKMQRITLTEAVDVTVNQVVVGFGPIEDSIANRKIVVKIYTDLNADGTFGLLAGTSDTLTVAELIPSDTAFSFTTFNFTTPAAIGIVSSFLVSVDISGVYFDENDAFDPKGNLSILSTPQNCGDGNNMLEIFPNNQGGVSFNTVFANWGSFNTEMYIGAIVDRGTFTSTRAANTDFSAVAFPNPTSDLLTVSFNAPAAGDFTARILSPIGEEVRRQAISAVRGSSQVAFGVADLPAGVYLFQVEGATGVQTGKFVKL